MGHARPARYLARVVSVISSPFIYFVNSQGLSRSLIAFSVCMMTFVWRVGTVEEPDPPYQSFTSRRVLVPRIIISIFFALGVVYLILVAMTFTRYGQKMENTWVMRTKKWVGGVTPGTVDPPQAQYPEFPRRLREQEERDLQKTNEVPLGSPQHPNTHPRSDGALGGLIPSWTQSPTSHFAVEEPASPSLAGIQHPFPVPGPGYPIPRIRVQSDRYAPFTQT